MPWNNPISSRRKKKILQTRESNLKEPCGLYSSRKLLLDLLVTLLTQYSLDDCRKIWVWNPARMRCLRTKSGFRIILLHFWTYFNSTAFKTNIMIFVFPIMCGENYGHSKQSKSLIERNQGYVKFSEVKSRLVCFRYLFGCSKFDKIPFFSVLNRRVLLFLGSKNASFALTC